MWGKGKRLWFQRVLLSLIALCCLLPMVYLLWGSLAGRGGVSQYERVLLDSREFYTWLWNSAGYTALILLLHIPISILAAYGLSQFRFPGRNALFFLYMLLMLLPFQATSVQQYLTLDALSILDTGKAVVLPCAYSAFGTFLLTQFMRSIDGEILEAARLDGVGNLSMLRHIILPLCKPAVVSVLVLQFISFWSMVDQPVLFLRSEQLMPLSVKLSGQSFGWAASAAGVIYAAAPVLVYLYCQDALEQGINLSSIK